MIYLIDEKQNRQAEYGWSYDKLVKYSDVLTTFYNYNQLELFERDIILKEGNTVILHESFFDAVGERYKSNSLQIRKNLDGFARENSEFNLVLFSGSISSRKLLLNIASLPVAILYQNLQIYIDKIRLGESNLEYLLFGENIDLEKNLITKFNELNVHYFTKSK